MIGVCVCVRMYVCGVFLCIVMIRESLREFVQNCHFQNDNNRIQNYYFLQQKCVHSFLFAGNYVCHDVCMNA